VGKKKKPNEMKLRRAGWVQIRQGVFPNHIKNQSDTNTANASTVTLPGQQHKRSHKVRANQKLRKYLTFKGTREGRVVAKGNRNETIGTLEVGEELSLQT